MLQPEILGCDISRYLVGVTGQLCMYVTTYVCAEDVSTYVGRYVCRVSHPAPCLGDDIYIKYISTIVIM